MTLLSARDMRSLVLHVVGVLLMFAGIALIAITAHSVISYRMISGRHGGETMDLGGDAILQAGQHGRMARVVSTPRVIEPPTDPDFNLRVNTPRLIRHVEMFQWRELHFSNDYTYELDWVDHPLDAEHFRHPGGHANPPSFPLAGKEFGAPRVQMGDFNLSAELLQALPGLEPVKPDMKTLPPNLAASFSANGDYLTTSAEPANPRLGDVRVSWEQVPLQQLTVFARVDSDHLVPAADAQDGKGYDVQIGDVALINLLPDLPSPPEYVFVRRIAALLLASIGAFVLLVARNRRHDPLLALGLGTLAVGAVSSVLWLGNDALMMGGWLLVTAAGIGLSVWRLRSHPPRAGIGR